MDILINFVILMSVGLWFYAVIIDYTCNRPMWAFFNFMIFPIGVVRGIVLSFE